MTSRPPQSCSHPFTALVPGWWRRELNRRSCAFPAVASRSIVHGPHAASIWRRMARFSRQSVLSLSRESRSAYTLAAVGSHKAVSRQLRRASNATKRRSSAIRAGLRVVRLRRTWTTTRLSQRTWIRPPERTAAGKVSTVRRTAISSLRLMGALCRAGGKKPRAGRQRSWMLR